MLCGCLGVTSSCAFYMFSGENSNPEHPFIAKCPLLPALQTWRLCRGVQRTGLGREWSCQAVTHHACLQPVYPSLRPGKQLYDQMPLNIAAFQFCQLSLRASPASPPLPHLLQETSPSLAWALVSLVSCMLSRSSWFPSTLWVRPSLPGMWLCLLLLPSPPTLTPRNSCASLHPFALTAGLSSALYPRAGCLSTALEWLHPYSFHFPPFLSQAPGFLGKVNLGLLCFLAFLSV